MSKLNVIAFGASPDHADDTDALQKAADAAQEGDVVLVPPGATFNVDPLRSVNVRSHTVLQVDGILKAIPNRTGNTSALVRVVNAENVEVRGAGTLIGERSAADAADPTVAEGHGLIILNSHGVVARDITSVNMKGDGFYLEDSTDIIVDGVTSSNVKRNGLSLISGERVTIIGSTFTLTNGPSPQPQAGIDIEPDLPQQKLLDINITKCRFIRNRGAGVYIAFQPSAIRTRVNVVNNYMDQHYKDGSGPPIGGRNSTMANLLYATCRGLPGYDYWCFPREFTT